MTEFSEIQVGDEVVLKHKKAPRNVAQGVVSHVEYGYLSIDDFGSFYEAGWKIEAYKRPRPPLPTEYGLYMSRSDARAISSKTLYCLYGNLWSWDKGGEWEDVSSDRLPADLVRLVPETETHNENTLRKAVRALVDQGVKDYRAEQFINAMLNAGILFRERA